MFELFFHLSVQLSLVFPDVQPGNSRNPECEKFLEKKKSLRSSLEKSGVLTWKNLLDSFSLIWLLKKGDLLPIRAKAFLYSTFLLPMHRHSFCLVVIKMHIFTVSVALVGCGKVGLLISGWLRCNLLTLCIYTHQSGFYLKTNPFFSCLTFCVQPSVFVAF